MTKPRESNEFLSQIHRRRRVHKLCFLLQNAVTVSGTGIMLFILKDQYLQPLYSKNVRFVEVR